MTREEAYEEIRKLIYEESEDLYIADAEEFVDKIFDDFESRCCDNCKWYDQEPSDDIFDIERGMIERGKCEHENTVRFDDFATYDPPKTFMCNQWESK